LAHESGPPRGERLVTAREILSVGRTEMMVVGIYSTALGIQNENSGLRAVSKARAGPARRALAWVVTALFLPLAPGTLAVYIPWRISAWRLPAFGAAYLPLQIAGGLLIAAGTGVLLESFARFAWKGLGSPAPVLPPEHLVVSGMYRFVRNPIYVAVTSAILGQAMAFASIRLLEYGAWCGFSFTSPCSLMRSRPCVKRLARSMRSSVRTCLGGFRA
jgi:protein-S-isoprenylcysteine O-methyltransferase Ste14